MSIALIEESTSARAKSRLKSQQTKRPLRASHPKISPRKLAANRRNSQKSTGPRTPAGKKQSSQNSLKHGLCSPSPLLPNECSATYNTIVEELRESLRPITPLQSDLFHQLCSISWKLTRINDTERQLYTLRQKHDDPPCLTLAKAFNANPTSNPFILYARYERHLRNTYLRLIREIKKLQKEDQAARDHARLTEPAFSPERHAAHLLRQSGQTPIPPDDEERWDVPSSTQAHSTGSSLNTDWYKELTNKWRERDRQKRLEQHRKEIERIEQSAATPPPLEVERSTLDVESSSPSPIGAQDDSPRTSASSVEPREPSVSPDAHASAPSGSKNDSLPNPSPAPQTTNSPLPTPKPTPSPQSLPDETNPPPTNFPSAIPSSSFPPTPQLVTIFPASNPAEPTGDHHEPE